MAVLDFPDSPIPGDEWPHPETGTVYVYTENNQWILKYSATGAINVPDATTTIKGVVRLHESIEEGVTDKVPTVNAVNDIYEILKIVQSNVQGAGLVDLSSYGSPGPGIAPRYDMTREESLKSITIFFSPQPDVEIFLANSPDNPVRYTFFNCGEFVIKLIAGTDQNVINLSPLAWLDVCYGYNLAIEIITRGLLLDGDYGHILVSNYGNAINLDIPEVKLALGINNVDNTSDEDKEISLATQAALNDKFDKVNVVQDMLDPNSFTTLSTAGLQLALAGLGGGGTGVPPEADYGDITVSNSGLTWTIDANAITETKIIDGAVTTNKLLDDAVTTAKILDENITFAKLDPALVVEDFTSPSDSTIPSSLAVDNLKGTETGWAPLDSFLKIPASYLPATSSLTYKGQWDPSSNTPTLVNGTGSTGDFYIISATESSTSPVSQAWTIGDWIIYNGTVWDYVDNSNSEVQNSITDGVTAFAPSQEAVYEALLLKADVTALNSGLATKADAAATTASLALKADASDLSDYQLTSEKGVGNGYAGLSSGKVPVGQLPDGTTLAKGVIQLQNSIATGITDKAPTVGAVYSAIDSIPVGSISVPSLVQLQNTMTDANGEVTRAPTMNLLFDELSLKATIVALDLKVDDTQIVQNLNTPLTTTIPSTDAMVTALGLKVDDNQIVQDLNTISVSNIPSVNAIREALLLANPPGMTAPFAGPTPNGWLSCNGQAVSRVTYANLYNYLCLAPGFASINVAPDHTTDSLTLTGHGFNGGERVRVSSITTLPTGISGAVDYFVVPTSPNIFKLCTTKENAAANGPFVSFTDNGVGTLSILQSLWGLGNGTTTFNVPDLNDDFIRGVTAGVRQIGTYQEDMFEAHSHAIDVFNNDRVAYGGSNTASSNGTALTGSTGGTETRPKNIGMNVCIKY